MTLLKLPLLMAMVAAVFVAWFAAGCAGGSAGPGDFVRPTAPAPATAVPTPTVNDYAYPPPNSSSDIAALFGVPEVCPEHGYCARLDLGGRLTAAAWLDEDRMYLADFEGRIRLLDVKTGVVTLVLDGLRIPRGLTVLDGRLYVSEMGNVCRLIRQVVGPDIGCKYKAGAMDLEFLSRTSAQVLSYQIDDSGGLSDRQVVVDRIISWDSDHAPNGLANDGEYVYVSVGHPQHRINPGHILITHADELKAHNRRTELMGAVARFRPPDDEVEVYATGLRNTYGISIAPDGTIYGVDNDQQKGLATEGQREELNAIVAGGFYGFPIYGTHEAPPEARVSEPVAVLQGAAGTFAHANQDGIYVAYLALDGSNDGYVVDRFDYAGGTPERIVSARGHTTAILERNGLLYLASLDGSIYVINPHAAAAPLHLGSYYPHVVVAAPLNISSYYDDYLDEVIADGGRPIIASAYDVYLGAGVLIYDKHPCTPADTEDGFFFHIVPVNLDVLPEDRRQYSFDNWGFSFDDYGWRNGDRCRAVHQLPEYDISTIRTGQSVLEESGWRNIWEGEYHFGR